jgi:ABC-type multidrug transport system fused ATPase/permease subunit
MRHSFRHFIGILLFLAMSALFGLVVMFLWNTLISGIFGLSMISYWQAVGLLILARVLFGGIGWGNSRRFGYGNIFRDKWFGMSETEKEAFLKRHGYDFHDRFRMGSCDTVKDSETKKE